MPSSSGRLFKHTFAVELSRCHEIVILSGNCKGFNEQIQSVIPRLEEVSIGDFMLTSGELPALCIINAITRLLPGAVNIQYEETLKGIFPYTFQVLHHQGYHGDSIKSISIRILHFLT